MRITLDVPHVEWVTRDHPLLGSIVEEVSKQSHIAIDTETTGLDIINDRVLFWSMAYKVGDTYKLLSLKGDTLFYFKQVFEDKSKIWLLANAKFDMHMLMNMGFFLEGTCYDTQVMHALLFEEEPHGLKYMSESLINYHWSDFKDTFKKNKVPDGLGKFRDETYQEVLLRTERENLEKLKRYTGNDAYATYRVYEVLREKLTTTVQCISLYPSIYPNLWELFLKTEAPFTKVLWDCERNGVFIDVDYLKELNQKINTRLNELARILQKMYVDIVASYFGKIEVTGGANRPKEQRVPEFDKLQDYLINLNSKPQMKQLVFNVLGFKPHSYSKGGKSGEKQPQLDDEFLKINMGNSEFLVLYAEYSELVKIKAPYVEGLADHLDSVGRIHPKFNQDVARTGRLSSKEPNCQNIPNPESDKWKIRKAFRARPGCKLICFDYEALEMRILAAASMEADMVNIFLEGKDIHMGNASMVFNLKYEDIKIAKKTAESERTPHQHKCVKARSDIKTIGFGLNYGMQDALLAIKMGCSQEDAKAIRLKYMDRYPSVKKFYTETIENTRMTGIASSILGRRRFFPRINSCRPFERGAAERAAVNMEIQGSAADVARMAMVCIHQANLKQKYGCLMLMQVHDELVFECPIETCEQAAKEIKEWMEHPLQSDLVVPLTVSGAIVDCWSEAK